MESNHSTVTIWQSGRLAPQAVARRFEFDFTREQWLGAALLVASAVVLALFVGVLERDVNRGEMAHQAQHARALAEAQCEADQPAGSRGTCIALFNGSPVDADAAAPVAAVVAQDDGAGPSAVSMNSLQAVR